MRLPRAQEQVSANLPTPDQAANLPLEAPVDAAEAWERFSAAWPFEPVPYRRAAAEAAFAELTYAEREAATTCAPLFVKAWRSRRRSGLPDARSWIRAKGWESFAPTPSSAPSTALPAAQSGARLMAERLPDGCYRLHPDSAQLQRWKDYERRTIGRARLGMVRPAEWPPDAGGAGKTFEASCPPPGIGDALGKATA